MMSQLPECWVAAESLRGALSLAMGVVEWPIEKCKAMAKEYSVREQGSVRYFNMPYR